MSWSCFFVSGKVEGALTNCEGWVYGKKLWK
jgi:hypothetical protein